jgi:WD40 repeat protein
LWAKRPPSEISSSYGVFAPDNKVLYAGGSEGCVYEMDVRTGKILSRWFASKSGKSEYGHRISALACSPDGRYLATGTGPEGLVWIWSQADGKLLKILKHGGGPVRLVSFSPDSKALATFVPGTLKVWNVAGWDRSSGE